MRRRFVTLDVFTDRRLAGNPLAVVLDADGLDGVAMQAIAREFNLSETVFVLPPNEPMHRAKLRIFTPAAEIPFAGHPTIGAAVLLARLDGGRAREMVVEEQVGPVRCRVEASTGEAAYARFDLPRLPEETSGTPDSSVIAAALGLKNEDIGFDRMAPSRWSAGHPFAFVPLRNLGAVERSRADMSHWDSAFSGTTGAFVFCRETVDAGNAFHARMFAPAYGVPEDPATGSAIAAFAGLLARHASLTDGDHEFHIEQGYEMRRPSLIILGMTIKDGRLVAGSIGGHAVVVSEGAIEA